MEADGGAEDDAGGGKKAGSQTAKQDLAILNDFVRMLEPGSTTSGDATLLELLQKLSKDVREKLHTFLKENLTAAGQGWRSPAFDPLLGSSRQQAAPAVSRATPAAVVTAASVT